MFTPVHPAATPLSQIDTAQHSGIGCTYAQHCTAISEYRKILTTKFGPIDCVWQRFSSVSRSDLFHNAAAAAADDDDG